MYELDNSDPLWNICLLLATQKHGQALEVLENLVHFLASIIVYICFIGTFLNI